MTHHDEFYTDPDELVPEEKQESLAWKLVRGLVAFTVIAALVYISGISQSLFYRRTPPTARQEQVRSMIDAETFTLSIAVFVVTGTDGSERDEEDIRRVVKNASRIWEQAGIKLQISNFKFLISHTDDIEKIISSERIPSDINVFFVKYLGGINGIAFKGMSSVAVADFTTVYDFRAFAHEVGHILGLSHVAEDQGRLMYQGANGFELSIEEITQARRVAERFATAPSPHP